MCTTANPPGAGRCFRCDADLSAPAPLLPARRRAAARRPSRLGAWLFPDLSALSPADRLRLGLSRALIVLTIVFLSPMLMWPFGYAVVIGDEARVAGLATGERVFIRRGRIEGLALGDVVTIGGGMRGVQIGEVAGILPAADGRGRLIEVRTAQWTVRVTEGRLDGRAAFVYRPLTNMRRLTNPKKDTP